MNTVRTREDCFDWLTMDEVQTEAFAAYVGAKRYFETHDFAAETRDDSPHAEDHVLSGGITYADGSAYVGRGQFLERVYDLLSSRARKAKWTNCRLVFKSRSQFFHSLLFLSSHAKLRSTIQRLGMTLKVCSSLLLAICTVTCSPTISCTPCSKGLPV